MLISSAAPLPGAPFILLCYALTEELLRISRRVGGSARRGDGQLPHLRGRCFFAVGTLELVAPCTVSTPHAVTDGTIAELYLCVILRARLAKRLKTAVHIVFRPGAEHEHVVFTLVTPLRKTAVAHVDDILFAVAILAEIFATFLARKHQFAVFAEETTTLIAPRCAEDCAIFTDVFTAFVTFHDVMMVAKNAHDRVAPVATRIADNVGATGTIDRSATNAARTFLVDALASAAARPGAWRW